jgi:hypothetical protein
MASAGAMLESWVLQQASESGREWMGHSLQRIADEPTPKSLFATIGFCSRRLGRDGLALTQAQVQEAQQLRAGWRPDRWSIDAAARVALLLRLPPDPGAFFDTFEKLCRMGEMQELVAYYGGLPLYPEPERYRARAAEGLRTNMQVVFEAVAHENPYPSEQLDEGAWNQMVLKALFIGSALHPIQGLERRANPRLTRMLCDYAHERWAAHRTISPELWRCVGAAADDAAVDDLAHALADEDDRQRDAAALALHGCGHPRAAALLAEHEDIRRRIETGELAWSTLA